jgi:hypothetical protein
MAEQLPLLKGNNIASGRESHAQRIAETKPTVRREQMSSDLLH